MWGLNQLVHDIWTLHWTYLPIVPFSFFQASKNEKFAETTRDILLYVMRDLSHKVGSGFFLLTVWKRLFLSHLIHSYSIYSWSSFCFLSPSQLSACLSGTVIEGWTMYLCQFMYSLQLGWFFQTLLFRSVFFSSALYPIFVHLTLSFVEQTFLSRSCLVSHFCASQLICPWCVGSFEFETLFFSSVRPIFLDFTLQIFPCLALSPLGLQRYIFSRYDTYPDTIFTIRYTIRYVT